MADNANISLNSSPSAGNVSSGSSKGKRFGSFRNGAKSYTRFSGTIGVFFGSLSFFVGLYIFISIYRAYTGMPFFGFSDFLKSFEDIDNLNFVGSFLKMMNDGISDGLVVIHKNFSGDAFGDALFYIVDFLANIVQFVIFLVNMVNQAIVMLIQLFTVLFNSMSREGSALGQYRDSLWDNLTGDSVRMFINGEWVTL